MELRVTYVAPHAKPRERATKGAPTRVDPAFVRLTPRWQTGKSFYLPVRMPDLYSSHCPEAASPSRARHSS